MLVAAAVCPHPPLLVPAVAQGAAAEMDSLRVACDEAVAALDEAAPDLVVLVGTADQTGPFPADAWGTLRPYGLALDVGRPAGSATAPTLPLSLTIGRWLLDRAAAPVPEPLLFGVPADADPRRCADLGAGIAERAGRVGLLVLGDGSARRSRKGPGYLDERAAPFDAAAIAALGTADVDALAALDPVLAAQLWVAGRAPWQVLAGAAAVPGPAWAARVLWRGTPYGVTYVVASWRRAQ